MISKSQDDLHSRPTTRLGLESERPKSALLDRVKSFLTKSPEQRRATLRFFARKGLSKISYFPIRLRLGVSPTEEDVAIWWSYVAETDNQDKGLFEYGGSDLDYLGFVWRALRPGMVFVDVGAHHGLYSVVAAKKLRGRGRIIAFEPSSRERRRLKVHLRLNRIANALVEPFALSSRSETVKLHTVVSGHTSMNSLRHPPLDTPVKEVAVQAIRMDEYLDRARIEQIDLLKIDTEGAEMDVFSGAERVLRSLRPVIICEVLDWVTEQWGYAARGNRGPAGRVRLRMVRFSRGWHAPKTSAARCVSGN